MNVNDKLQLIRALEEREVAARRTSGRVAWTSVVVAALVLFVMIGLAQRQLGSLRGQVADEKARLANVRAEIADATEELKKVGGSDGALDAAKDSLAAASVAAGDQVRPNTPDRPPLPEASNRKDAIARLFDQNSSVRVRAYGELLPRYANDPTLVPEIIEVARTQPKNANGTYNALVVLSHMNARTLSANRKEVIEFAEQSQGIGPRVADRANTLIRRVPAGR